MTTVPTTHTSEFFTGPIFLSRQAYRYRDKREEEKKRLLWLATLFMTAKPICDYCQIGCQNTYVTFDLVFVIFHGQGLRATLGGTRERYACYLHSHRNRHLHVSRFLFWCLPGVLTI